MATIGPRLKGTLTSAYSAIFRRFEGIETQEKVIRDVEVNGIHLRIKDFRTSVLTDIVVAELRDDAYNIEHIHFQPGDIAIDIGANIGIVSIYLARRYPGLTIHAFEPIPDNYDHLTQNLRLNGVRNIIAHPLAITKDGRAFEMIVHLSNSGGGTGCLQDMRLPDHEYYTTRSTTLDRVFAEYEIQRCRLLKIDCEGAEYEILWNTHCLERVDYLSGEFHMNQRLAHEGYSAQTLLDHCQQYLPPEHLKVTFTPMAE